MSSHRSSLATAQFQRTSTMPSSTRTHRRHARRNSSQSRALATLSEPQTPTARRRNLYRPPASVATRHARVHHWNAELHDLTQNLADIQQRIQQLETLQPPEWPCQRTTQDSVHPAFRPRRPSQRVQEDSVPPPARPRAPSTPYRLPELNLDSTNDSFDLPLDEWLHASAPRAPTSDTVRLSSVKHVDEQSSALDLPEEPASRKSARARQTVHSRDESTNTVGSFDSYATEAVQVYEASTAAVVRPCVRNIAPAQVAALSARGQARKRCTDEKNLHQPRAALVPLPLFAGQTFGFPGRISSPLQPRSSSKPPPSHTRKESRHSQPSPWSARGVDWTEDTKSRPVSETTVIRQSKPLSACSTPSSAWATASFASDDAPCLTIPAPQTPQPSFSVTGTMEQSSTPRSFPQARWQQSSPPSTEGTQLDSSCSSVSDPITPTSSLPKTSARLNLFPRIQQSSYESLGRRYHSEYDTDPFYAVGPDQTPCVGWEPSSPTPMSGHAAADTTDLPSEERESTEETSSSLHTPRRRADHRLREMLNPGVKRQTRDIGSNQHVFRSPRKKLRTFLRRFTPTMGKVRHSMPAVSAPPAPSSMAMERQVRTPPRLPTRQGSSLPFDEAILGELSRISDRGCRASSAAPSSARRIRNSMHDAAGLRLSRTAATHAHWRAQRSRSSILSSMHPRSRAPTGSTVYGSLSSGPSFHFLPKVDQLPVTPVRRGPPPVRHRKSRY